MNEERNHRFEGVLFVGVRPGGSAMAPDAREDTAIRTTPTLPRWWTVVAWAALIWNLLGIATFVVDVSMSPERIAQLSEAEWLLRTQVPAWATAAYGIAVLTGVYGCVGLLLRTRCAVWALGISLAAIIVQMGHAIFFTDMLRLRGLSSTVMPVVITVIAALLYALARKQHRTLQT
jgi:hypothetical protein